MNNIYKQFTLIMCIMLLLSCDRSINSSSDTIKNNIFYNAAKNAMPIFKVSNPSGRIGMAKVANITWDFGEPVYEMFNTFKDYDPVADTGSNQTGIDNIYKLLYQNGSFYNDCLNLGTSTGDIKLSSPYDFGRIDNTYNKELNQESAGHANYFAAKKDGNVNYCLLCWYRGYTADKIERGVLQGYFNEVTGDLNLDLVCYVENTGSVFSLRTHLEGNSNTHRFTKLLTGKWNSGSASFRAWFAGSGMACGAGNTFLFKIKDNSSLTTEKYFEFPADADVTTLQGMSNAGSATTSSSYKSEVDAMVNGGEYFDILNVSPIPSEIPSSATHFHGTGIGNMKPVAETLSEVDGKWYGKSFNLTITGDYFQLSNVTNTIWLTGEVILNASTNPKQMDIRITGANDNNNVGKTALGIYKIDNGILIYKVSDLGDTTRPTEFNMLNGMLMAFSRDPNNLPDVPGSFKEFPFMPLRFHVADTSHIHSINVFGIPDWSGPGKPHTDLDLHMDTGKTNGTTILSPTYGTVASISYKTFGTLSIPPDLMMVSVKIYVNSSITVDLVFEPFEKIDFVNNQLNEIKVMAGQEVKPGDMIGNLVGGTYGWPCLALRLIRENQGRALCPYIFSSDSAKAIYDKIILIRGGSVSCGQACCMDSVDQY